MLEEQLKELRDQIDKIDEQIVSLIDQRFVLAEKVGAVKQVLNIPIYNEKREEEVYDHVRSIAKHPQLKELIGEIYKQIIVIFRQLQIQSSE